MKIGLLKFFMCLLILVAITGMCDSAVFAESIMVIVPHEDDEALLGAGVIKNAILKNDTVNVVLVTNGDIGGIGPQRIGESINAMTYLGVNKNNIYFLGYGDTGVEYNVSFLMKLYNSASSTQIYSSNVGTKTYGNPAIGVNDYHYTLYGVHGDYNRTTLLADIQSIIDTKRPNHIYTTSMFDYHGDHAALYLFINEAILNIKKIDSNYSPVMHQGMVHAQGGADDGTWPVRDSDPTPIQPFTQPGNLSVYTTLDWNGRESIPVPPSMLTLPRVSNEKRVAISKYPSQTADAASYLYSFTKSDEVFWRKDYSNIAPLATISVSSESTTTKQTGVKAVDGIPDGYPRYTACEWATNGQGSGAWIKLNWINTYAVSRIVLYDRPNGVDQIQSATLSFSDGSTVGVSTLPNYGTAKVITFPLKRITWVKLTVNTTAAVGNIGLSEFEVYGYPDSEGVIGNKDGGNVVDNTGADLTFCRFMASQSISATSVKVNIANAPGRVKCAVYSESAGKPGTLLKDTYEIANPGNGWQTFNLTAALTLQRDTYYWLAVWSDSPDFRIAADSTGPGLYTSSYTYGAWPNSPTGTMANGFTHCIYAEGTVLEFTMITVDNGTAGYSTVGTWSTTATGGYNNTSYQYATAGTAKNATWAPNLPTAGTWRVSIMYRAGTNRATSAKFNVATASGIQTVYMNQTLNNLTWVTLGTWSMNVGGGNVTLDAAGSSGGTSPQVIADVVRYEYVSP